MKRKTRWIKSSSISKNGTRTTNVMFYFYQQKKK